MEIYNSEQEQVEALKAWWEKNGRSALTILAIFLLSVLGWQAWHDHRNKVAEAASTQYQALAQLSNTKPAEAMETGRALIAGYPDTVYADMAAMVMARLAVEQGDLDGAAAHLRSALDAGQPELAEQARVRLVRVELAQGKLDEAMATLNDAQPTAEVDELRGDILAAQGKVSEARDAYSKAVAGYVGVIDKQELVQMKLNNLAERTAE